jgi:hypothetical protein
MGEASRVFRSIPLSAAERPFGAGRPPASLGPRAMEASIGCGADGRLAGIGLDPGDVGTVSLTGDTAQVPAGAERFSRRFGAERLGSDDPLVSPAHGLALRARGPRQG